MGLVLGPFGLELKWLSRLRSVPKMVIRVSKVRQGEQRRVRRYENGNFVGPDSSHITSNISQQAQTLAGKKKKKTGRRILYTCHSTKQP